MILITGQYHVEIITESWYRYKKFLIKSNILVYRIDVWDEINVQVGKFLENIKHADQTKALQGGFFFSKLINMHAIRHTRV